MKGTIMMLVGLIVFTTISLGNIGIRTNASMKQKYKDSLDAGANAAVKHITYASEESLEGASKGFGEGYEATQNVYVDKESSLKWFYEVLYRNMGISEDNERQNRLKSYIPMKALVTFDSIKIANLRDEWVVDEQYLIEYSGVPYLFTLTNQVQNSLTGQWLTDMEIGLTPAKRKSMVVQFVSDQINIFLNDRENKESNIVYTVSIGLDDYDPKNSTLNGVNFLTLIEGVPMSSMNLLEPQQKFYSFSYGGSELYRKLQD